MCSVSRFFIHPLGTTEEAPCHNAFVQSSMKSAAHCRHCKVKQTCHALPNVAQTRYAHLNLQRLSLTMIGKVITALFIMSDDLHLWFNFFYATEEKCKPKRDRGEGGTHPIVQPMWGGKWGQQFWECRKHPHACSFPPPDVNLISLSKPWYILSPHNLPKANFLSNLSKTNILSYAKKEDIKQVLLQIHLVIQHLCCDSNLSVAANVIVSAFERTPVSNCMLLSWNVNIKSWYLTDYCWVLDSWLKIKGSICKIADLKDNGVNNAKLTYKEVGNSKPKLHLISKFLKVL